MNNHRKPKSDAGAILPTSVPIPIDGQFDREYGRDAWISLPSAIRKELWWKLVGNKLKRERDARIAAAKEVERQRYRRERERIAARDKRIQQKRERQRKVKELQELRGQLAYRQPTPERFQKLHRFLQNRLQVVLDGQQELLRQTFSKAVKTAFDRAIEVAIVAAFLLATVVFGLLLHGNFGDLVKAVPWGGLFEIKSLHVWGLVLAKMATPLFCLVVALYCDCFATHLLKLLRDDRTKKNGSFWLHYELPSKREPGSFYTPVMLGRPGRSPSDRDAFLESDPFNADAHLRPKLFRCVIVLMIFFSFAMVLGVFVPRIMFWSLVSFTILVSAIGLQGCVVIGFSYRFNRRPAWWKRRVERLLQIFHQQSCELFERYMSRSSPRKRPQTAEEFLAALGGNDKPRSDSEDNPWDFSIFTPRSDDISPPTTIFEDGVQGNYEHILRGTRVHEWRDVLRLASHRLLANGLVRPFSFLGGVPLLRYEGQSPHVLCVGASGSGKTTFIRLMMTHLLPLSQDDLPLVQLAQQKSTNNGDLVGHPLPAASLWSRSFTHQAVVYNSKNENIPFLASMGFKPGRDMFILDPADSRCHAWDLAADVDNRDSIRRFAAIIVPRTTGNSDTHRASHWENKARRLVEAVVISFRNMAIRSGTSPSWNLRDLVCAFRSQGSVKELIKWHDDPEGIRAELFDLDPKITDSNFTTVTEFVRSLDITAARWFQAEKEGRKISLKHWLGACPHSTLVLPNTMDNATVNEPLNRMFITFLTEAILKPEYSFYVDQKGRRSTRQRFFFLDEFGQAGKLPEIYRLMTEARSFGTQVIVGMHQLSHLRENYGDNGTENLMGLCSHVALLRNGDPTTNQWASDRIGVCLKEYQRKSFSYGSSEGRAYTTSTGENATTSEATSQQFGRGRGSSTSPDFRNTSSTPLYTTTKNENTNTSSGNTHSRSTGRTYQQSESTSTSTSEQTTESTELRQEAAVYPSDFAALPDPSSTGQLGGYYISPSLPTWKAVLRLEDFLRRIPRADESVPETVPWDDDELASKLLPWDDEDKRRMGIHISNQPDRPEQTVSRRPLPTSFEHLD